MSGFLQKDVPVSPKQIDELEQLIRTKFDQSTGYAEVHCKSRALHQAFRKSIFGDTDWMVLDSFRSVMERLNCSHQNSPVVAALFARYDPLNTGAVGLRAFSESIFRLRPTPHCDPTHRVMIARVHEHLRAYGGDSGLRLLNVKLTQLAQLHRFGPKGVTKDQLIDALISCGVPPRDAQFVPAVFDLYNPDPETGRVEVQWFVGSVRPKPSQARLIAAKRVFGTLHKNVDGVLTLQDMTTQFQPQGHPRVMSGDLSVDNAVLEFRAAWEGWAPQAVITEAKFVEYLTDLSACIDEDAYFDALLRGVWDSAGGVDAQATVRSVAATVRDLSGERTHLDSSIPPPITKAPGVTVRAYGAHSTARTNPRHFAGIGGPFKELKQFRDDDAQLALAAPYRGYSTTTAAMSMGNVAAVGAALQVEVTHLNGQRTIETVDASTLQQQQRAAAPEDTTESIVVRALRRGGVTDVLHARVVA